MRENPGEEIDLVTPNPDQSEEQKAPAPTFLQRWFRGRATAVKPVESGPHKLPNLRFGGRPYVGAQIVEGGKILVGHRDNQRYPKSNAEYADVFRKIISQVKAADTSEKRARLIGRYLFPFLVSGYPKSEWDQKDLEIYRQEFEKLLDDGGATIEFFVPKIGEDVALESLKMNEGGWGNARSKPIMAPNVKNGIASLGKIVGVRCPACKITLPNGEVIFQEAWVDNEVS